VKKPARIAGWVLATFVVAGVVQQVGLTMGTIDTMRPVTVGNTAPAFALPVIETNGALGPKRGITPGKVTVIDFWATWCKPCIVALPKLQRIATAMPDVEVITVNLDDAAAARKMFDEAGLTLVLLADDGAVSERYNVAAIPHTVVIGKDGSVERVFRGGTTQLEAAVQEIRKQL
jgi:thiol-disulfide isomerase/thioredoxin